MSVSDRKLQANRQNAQKSTGPRTPEGKAVCSLNAITHGLRARHAVMLIEDREAFQSLCQELYDEWQPMTASECHMVEQMAVSRWKTARLETVISSAGLQSAFMHLAFKDLSRYRSKKGNFFIPDLTRNPSEIKMQKMLDSLQRHQATLERSYFQALQTLQYLQKLRREKMQRLEEAKAQARAQEETIEKVMTAGAGTGGFEIAFEPEGKPVAKVTRYGNTWTRKDSA